MEISSVRWLSELGMDDHTFIHQCQMNSLDEFGSQQIAAALEDDFQYTFSAESFSSYPTFNPGNSTTTFSNSSMEASQTVTERPTKQLKTNSWNSCTTDHISTTHEASSSPNMLSFGNSTNSPTNHPQHLFGNPVGIVKPKDEAVSLGSMIFPSPVLISHDSYGSQNYVTKAGQGIKTVPASRPASTTQDHIIAERKRREKLSQSFIALSAIVPGLKKMDKASVLGDAIKYLKQLQERVKTLEEQAAKKTVESVVFVKKSQISTDDDNSSSDENLGGHPDEPLPEIEARVSEKNVLIRIHCENQKGVVKKTLAEIEKLHLTLVNSSVIPFGNSVLDITIVAQMDVDFSMTVKDLVRHLRSAFRHFVCEDKE